MNKAVLFLLIICSKLTVFGQEIPKDSLQINHNRQFTTEKQISIRGGIGFQKNIFPEVGLALHECNYSDVGFFSNDFYTAIEWIPNTQQNLYGLKIGYEANTSILLLNGGIELKYLTDFKEKDIVIMPKIGFGLFGDVNIFYGYAITTNNNPFEKIIGNHQLSIVFNFNNHFLKYR